MTRSVETVSESGTVPTIAEGNPGGIPTVTIVAAVCGTITGILVTVLICVCVVCITKRMKVHIYCNQEEKSDTSRHQQNTSNSTGTMVEMNMAYSRAVSNYRPDPTQCQTATETTGQCLQFNQAYGSQDGIMQGGEEIESVGDYERMSAYVAFHHSIPTQREKKYSHLARPMVNTMSVQQGQPSPGENDEHPYDYIQ